MFYGLLNLPWWGYVLFILGTTQITILTVTVFLHRSQAHRALDLHPILMHFFRLWLWLTTGMVTKAWVSIHRKHHAKCETPEDPHSPQVFGLSKVLWQGAELYRREAANAETLARYGTGTPDDWLERTIYAPLSSKGIYILMALYLALFGVPGLALWAIQMSWIPFFAAGVVNGVAHYWGYRNFECPDASTNLTPFGLFIGGEELHNNHHTYPTSAKFSLKWWEFDIGWGYITLFRWLGLAKVKRVAPQVKFIPGKRLDIDTLRAVINNRFQVMSCYTKDVLMPVFKQEKEKVNPQDLSLWERMKQSLIKEPSTLDAPVKQSLMGFLEHNVRLNQVYEYRERLSAIWAESAASQKELLEALQKWCQEAEATGVKSLREFASYIQGYTLASQVS